MPLAMVSFAAPYVAMLFTIQWLQPAGGEGFADLAYLVGLLLLGVLLIAVVIPMLVFSLGRALDATTHAWGTVRAALAFGGAGLALGLVLATLLSWVQGVSMVGAIANVAVPAAIGGLGTRLLLPVALRHRWVVVLAWVLAAMPVIGVVALLFASRFQ
jgi:hypothetical protein